MQRDLFAFTNRTLSSLFDLDKFQTRRLIARMEQDGLAQQVETELGFVDAYIDAGIATHATARERQQPNVA